MALKNIIITGSIGTYPTLSYGQKEYISSTDEQSFPIEHITGSNGGSMPDLNGQYSTTDLYVNITQSWDVVINTPVGLVTSVHDTQDEFINGEFSGSILEVANQRLIDEDCEQFLKVSTVEVNYDPYFYSGLFTDLSSFINSSTSPNNGELYLYTDTSQLLIVGPKVTYIKINRYDNGGNDNTLSLQELTTLRLQTSTGILNFNLLTITEYPTYYLYTTYTSISFLVATVSPDSNVLDHHIVASKTGTTPVAGDDSVIVTNYNTVTTDTLGYFNPTTGLITFGDTPNIEIYITASVTVPDVYQDFSLFGSSEGRIVMVSGGPGTITLSTSLSPIENSTYWLFIENNGAGASSYSNVNLLLTQSISPSSSTNLTVLEPYLTENFFYNDCNSLYGNADGLEYSTDFMSVNYDNGSIIPSNQSQILNRTAERAPVKPYNYSARAQILPRYNGVRTTSLDFNLNTVTLDTFDDCNINSIRTGEPNVQSLGTYFAYYDYTGGTSPELYNRMGCHIVYLIDTDGNVFSPTLDSPYYPNLIDTFPTGKNVKIATLTSNPGSVNQIQITYPVFRPGILPLPIIYTQIGPTNVTASSILFENPLDAVPDYGSSVGLTNGALYVNSNFLYNILDVTSPSSPSLNFIGTGNVQWNPSPPTDVNFEILTTTNKTDVTPILTIDLQAFNLNFPYTSVNATIKIVKYDLISSTWVNIKNENIIIYQNNLLSYTVTASPQNPINGDQYRATIIFSSLSGGYIGQSGGTFTLTQTVPTSLQTIIKPYWTTGSSSQNILTGSVSMSSNVYGLTMTKVTGSGYFDSLPFEVQRLDEIRFEADENQTYQILSVSSPLESIDGRLYLTINKDIVTGTDLDSFLLRRFNPDASFVILDTSVNPTPNASGFIIPEFISTELSDNLPKILSNLYERNLI